ncbi:Di-copper centre-containing protein [Periconia macrospinosa]|uniref:Di-copper centre-containing protein n=1 Tax=Periconia macrospinosa TaxID=97972 RepID=A0A2V1CYP5_9PLEO|nr:Di-copper centre-containing protein [Periconia macrospinosa]
MHFLSLLSMISLVSAAALIHPRQNSTGCTNPEKRVEFRTLDAVAQKQYTDAVMCLSTKPSTIGLNTTLYDDFTYIHTHLNELIHYVAMFLPWHRYFVQLYHSHLGDCGYTGPMVYWDWTLDAADPAKSSIWAVVGGNGGEKTEKAGNQEFSCLTDGPFKGLRPAYFQTAYAPHCLSRDFFDGIDRPGNMRGSAYSAEQIQIISEKNNYSDYRLYLESIPHGSIHSAVGGEKGDMRPSSSPNEPLFFMHHTQIDRLWYLWQQSNPELREKDIKDQKFNPDDGTIATLEDIMPFMGLAADIKISEIMTTQNDLLCYIY